MKSTSTLVAIAMLTVGLAGPAAAELKLKMPKAPWKKSQVKESKYGQPSRMVVIWTPDVLSTPGKPATRGLGGRIYFYNNQNKTVPVEGQLVVYVYDEELQEHKESKVPNRRYGFTPEQFSKKYSESNLGASYNVWIPWDTQGSPLKRLQVIPIFTSVTGHHVMGKETSAVLHGPKPEGAPRDEQIVPLGGGPAQTGQNQNAQPPVPGLEDSR